MSQQLDPEILALIRVGFTSVWTLEILLLLRGAPEQEWQESDLVRDLRASPMIVREGLASLVGIGAAARNGKGFNYAADGPLDRTIGALADAYRTRPVAVMKAIAEAPDERIRTFADAFRIVK